MKKVLTWFLSCKLASLLKLSFIIGSHTAFFSGINIANPLAGKYLSSMKTLTLFSLFFLFKFGISGEIHLQFLAFIIPGLFAALYWNVSGPLVRAVVPALCFVLFLAHPTGLKAAPYALFWLIPITLYFAKPNTMFLHALNSTLIAHAVGSVIWMYTVPMAPSVWLGLIPIVFLERFTFALGITVCDAVIYRATTRQLNNSETNIACV